MSFFSAQAAASLVCVATSGRLQSLRVRNRNSAARYVFVYDAKVAPSDGTVSPLIPPILLAATSDNGFGSDYFTNEGVRFVNGLVVVISTSDNVTQTTATAADHDISGVLTAGA